MKRVPDSSAKLVRYVITALTLVVAMQTTAFGSEVERNQEIMRQCQGQSQQYSDGNGQTTPLCQQAMYYDCLADKFSGYYPEQSRKLAANRNDVCLMLNKMSANCPACN